MSVTSLEEEALQLRAQRARDRLSAGLSALRVRRRSLGKKLRPARYLLPAVAVGGATVVLGLMMRNRAGGPSLLGELTRRALLSATGVVATQLAVRFMSSPALQAHTSSRDD